VYHFQPSSSETCASRAQWVYSPFSGGYTTLMNDRIPRLDKTAFCVSPLTGPSDEKAYWLSKTPSERLEALEIMRQIVYGYDPDTTRLQRLFEIAQRASR